MRRAEPVAAPAPERSAPAPSAASPVPSTALPLASLQQLVGNRAVTALLLQRSPATAPPGAPPAKGGEEVPARPRLTPVGEARFERFRLAAATAGVGLSGARQLWALGGAGGSDAVTGLARASDASEVQEIAARHVARHDSPGFLVSARVRNLGGLNASLAHSGSDEIYARMAEIVERQLVDLGGDVEGFRKGGPEFAFVVVPKVPLSQVEAAREALRARLEDARALVRGMVANSGLSGIAHPRRPDDPGSTGSGIDLDLSDLVATTGSAHAPESGATKISSPPAPRPGPGFVGVGEERERAFLAAAAELGVGAEAAARLYGLTSGSERDELTGFSPASDRMATVAKAAGFAAANQVTALYVEVDIANLGGLNAEIGESEASRVMARIAAITHAELAGLSSTVCAFRHGGDEISFVVVSRRGAAGGDLDSAARARLEAAESKIRAEFSHLSGVAHPKHPHRPERGGTGIVYATAAIAPGSEPTAVVAAADAEVERRKA